MAATGRVYSESRFGETCSSPSPSPVHRSTPEARCTRAAFPETTQVCESKKYSIYVLLLHWTLGTHLTKLRPGLMMV